MSGIQNRVLLFARLVLSRVRIPEKPTSLLILHIYILYTSGQFPYDLFEIRMEIVSNLVNDNDNSNKIYLYGA